MLWLVKGANVLWVSGGAIAGACALAVAFLIGRADAPAGSRARVALRSTPGVIVAIHDVARLEATVFHVEKVVEASDSQSHFWGLLKAKDDVLLIAAGDVVAGVDLTKVRSEDVRVDETARKLVVRVPPPEILATTLDEKATHVYSRSTDVLAVRNEQLEGDARRAAEEQMQKSAIDGGILERARTSAEATLRALLRPMGFETIEFDWADRG